MTIQFFGLPGSGKTFIAQKKAGQENIPIVSTSRFEELFWFCLFVLHKPVACYKVIALLMKEPARLFIHKIRLFVKFSSLQSKSFIYKKSIIDDGLCQFALTLFDRKIERGEVSIIQELLGRVPTTIIIVEASETERMSRMQKRGRVPRAFLGDKYLEALDSIWTYNAQVIKEYYTDHFTVEIIKN